MDFTYPFRISFSLKPQYSLCHKILLNYELRPREVKIHVHIYIVFLFQGDAVFWWNLKKSGKGDYFTMHAGCPVLVGSKWGRYNKCTEQKSKMFVSHAMLVSFYTCSVQQVDPRERSRVQTTLWTVP